MGILLSLATLAGGILAGLALSVFVIRPLQAARQVERLARRQRDFRRQREQLEAKFIDRASSSGKPRGLRWSDVAFEDEVSYARDRKTGELRALVAIEVCFEAIEGGGMEEVEAVSNVRAATAEFRHDGESWQTDGRVFFNLAPKGLIRYLHTDLESVDRIADAVGVGPKTLGPRGG
jgi:hypothetical protein